MTFLMNFLAMVANQWRCVATARASGESVDGDQGGGEVPMTGEVPKR